MENITEVINASDILVSELTVQQFFNLSAGFFGFCIALTISLYIFANLIFHIVSSLIWSIRRYIKLRELKNDLNK